MQSGHRLQSGQGFGARPDLPLPQQEEDVTGGRETRTASQLCVRLTTGPGRAGADTAAVSCRRGGGGRPAADSRSTRSGRGVRQREGNCAGRSSSGRSATHPEALSLGSFSGGRPGRLGLASVWEPKPPAVSRLVCKWVVTRP